MKKTLIILAIFFLAFSVRIVYVISHQTTIESDEIEYDKLAMKLIEGKGYVDNNGYPTSYRPPGYPIFLAAIYKTFGHKVLAAKIAQALIGSLTVCLLYLIALRLFNNIVAVAAGIFASFYMTFVACTNLLFTETLFTFLLASTYFLAITTSKITIRRFIGLGILCGIITMIRSAGFFIPFILIFYMAFKTDNNNRKKIAASLVMIACFFLVLLPWTVRNYNAYGKVVLVSTNSGLNLYQGVSWSPERIYYPGASGEKVWEKAKATSNEAERNNIFLQEAIKIYKTKPLLVLKMLPVRFLFFWNIVDWEVLGSDIINYHYIFIFPFTLIGAFLCIKEKRKILLASILILYFSSFTLVFPGAARYRMPVDGYIIMIGCYGIYDVIKRSRKKILSSSLITMYFAFTFVIYKYSLGTKEFIKDIVEKIGLW